MTPSGTEPATFRSQKTDNNKNTDQRTPKNERKKGTEQEEQKKKILKILRTGEGMKRDRGEGRGRSEVFQTKAAAGSKEQKMRNFVVIFGTIQTTILRVKE